MSNFYLSAVDGILRTEKDEPRSIFRDAATMGRIGCTTVAKDVHREVREEQDTQS